MYCYSGFKETGFSNVLWFSVFSVKSIVAVVLQNTFSKTLYQSHLLFLGILERHGNNGRHTKYRKSQYIWKTCLFNPL